MVLLSTVMFIEIQNHMGNSFSINFTIKINLEHTNFFVPYIYIYL